MASWWRCRCSPMRRRFTTAATCWRNTARKCPRPGRTGPRTAKLIQDGERAAGQADIWGYVWQGNAYEGLTCDALEWIKSLAAVRSSRPTAPSRSITNMRQALDMAKSWVGTISPEGVLAHKEEDARGVWQTGNAVFMRNWPYAFGPAAAMTAPSRASSTPAPSVRRHRRGRPGPRRWAAGTSPCPSSRPSRRRRLIWRCIWPRPRGRSAARCWTASCRR